MSLYLIAILTYVWCIFSPAVSNTPPHILLFLADDLGWNDVSFHGSPQIPTPNIDACAASGIIVNNHYAAPQCTPSRASLMTGRYPINTVLMKSALFNFPGGLVTNYMTGLQHFVIKSGEKTSLPTRFRIMPEYLKKLGYSTNMIGKWHLGFFKKEYTPTFRGFDYHFGYWNGEIDYYTHTNYETTTVLHGKKAMWGIDLHENMETVRNFQGKYAQDLFTEKAVNLINNHNATQPFFLYMSNIAAHTGNAYERLQATPERVAEFCFIKDPKRRLHAACVKSLDDSFGRLVLALEQRGMLNNTIIVIISDNGGEAAGVRGGQGSNYPLRGMKFDTWEGGVKTIATICGPKLNIKVPKVSMNMMHISDWLPTIYSAAGGNVLDLGEIDGIDMWKSLINNEASPRQEVILQIDPIYKISALRQKNMKLVLGTFPNASNTWLGPSGLDDVRVNSMDAWVWRNGSSIVKQILEKNGWWLITKPDEWRKNASVRCNRRRPHNHHPSRGGDDESCNSKGKPCLFDVEKDPCEYNNIAYKNPEIVERMLKRICEYKAKSMAPLSKKMDPLADPECHGFAYVPWMEEEYACLHNCTKI